MRMRFFFLLAALLLSACTTVPSTPHAVTFFVVRHAEKVDASRNPDLNAQGQARASALADRFSGQDLTAIYATEFKRTGQTVMPVAQRHHVAPIAYPAAQPAAEFASRLRAAHPQGGILIAGHSDTVPAIVAALCECEVAPMPDHEYDRLSIVTIDGNGQARLHIERYGAPSVAP